MTFQSPNCVGYAYSVIGYKPDGYYPTKDVLLEFDVVSREEAELAASMSPRGVNHVVALKRDEQGFITHRPMRGADIRTELFEDAIGSRSDYAVTSKILYLRRKEL